MAHWVCFLWGMSSPQQTVVEFTGTPARWDIVGTSGDSVLVMECKNSAKQKPELSATVLRDQFLALRTPQDLKAFLNRTGVFDPSITRIDDLGGWQMLIRSLMTSAPMEWRGVLKSTERNLANAVLRYRNHVVHFPLEKGETLSVIRASCTLEALMATVLLDHLQGIRYGTCRREDCGKLFRLETDRERIYCSQYCGHLVSLRRKRLAAKSAKKSSAAGSKRKGTRKT